LGKSLCKQGFSRFAQSGGIHRIQLPPNLHGPGRGCKGFSFMPTFRHFEGGAFANRNEPRGDKLSAGDVFEDIFALKEIYLLIDQNLMIGLAKVPGIRDLQFFFH
jgi:hypothetical protein